MYDACFSLYLGHNYARRYKYLVQENIKKIKFKGPLLDRHCFL